MPVLVSRGNVMMTKTMRGRLKLEDTRDEKVLGLSTSNVDDIS